MCGILGYLSYSNSISNKDFERGLDLIYHRGPDDWGMEIHQSADFDFFQGFRRLSIIDLSDNGHQPMMFENLTITFNGEVYNFKEIRAELIKHNYSFESDGDTEVILKAIHCWGVEKAVGRFIGMFAIAVFNKQNKELTLVRDRVGIKPLYYYDDAKAFVYSSEIKPILSFDNIDKSFDQKSIIEYLSVGYTPAPRTLFSKIKSLEPGKILRLKNKTIEIASYWNLAEQFNKRSVSKDSEQTIKEQLKQLIESSVQYRMISDVPIGAFLSGGIDSSLVSAVMQKLSDKPINTFSIGFNEEKFNEANFAKEISAHLGTKHYELYLSIDEAKEMIPKLIKKLDQPFGDSSSIPMMMVSELAQQNVTVALSGDGGDELFCGYRLYDQALSLQRYKPFAKLSKPLRNSIIESRLMDKKYKYLTPLFSSNDEEIINAGNIVNQFFAKRLLKGQQHRVEALFSISEFNSKNIQELNMLANIDSYLHDDILKKVDFATMAASIESRVPLLDHRIIEYSFNIPHRLKYKDGVKKYILKELLYDYIPKSMMDRPKKGFSVPIFEWLHHDLYNLVEDSTNTDYLIQQDIFDIDDIQKFKLQFKMAPNNYFVNTIMWNFVVFQQWYKEHLL